MLKPIVKSVEINASKEKVWETLFSDESYRVWASLFSPGSYAESEWQEGSHIMFMDESDCGLVGTLTKYVPNETLSVTYEGAVLDGVEDYTSADALSMKGGVETYVLTETNGVTRLDISSDMSDEYFDSMSKLWDAALLKIKELAEGVAA